MENTITVKRFKKLLKKAGAITIDDSPLLTEWGISGDKDALIDTRWSEEELEYNCFIGEVEKIVAEKGSFLIHNYTKCPTRICLFKLKCISI